MLNLLKKPFKILGYIIERRKYIKYLKTMPQDIETRIGFVDFLLQNKNYNEASKQYKIIKDENYKGSRFEELLEAKGILKSKGYEI